MKIVANVDLARKWEISIAAVNAEAAEIYVNPLVRLETEEWRFVLAQEMLHAPPSVTESGSTITTAARCAPRSPITATRGGVHSGGAGGGDQGAGPAAAAVGRGARTLVRGARASVEKRRSYARASRRRSATPDIPRPGWIRPEEVVRQATFGVVLDTSGSMDTKLLGKALGAIASYAMARGVPRARVVFCDAMPYDVGHLGH
jgi:hypothetical protein